MPESSSTTVTPVKRALLIGIDAYQTAPKIPILHGCVNDAQLVRSILEEQFGFPPENMTMLVDAEATRDAILAAFDALVAATAKDDIVVFYYAGHGSQMTDREGDEASGLDNTIMPCDSEGWSGVNRDITDDEIHLRLVALGEKTAYTTLIVDACHSATITRDAFGEASRGVQADTRPVSELPPSPIPAAAARSVGGAAGERGPSGWVPLANQYVLIAGCRDEETSKEHRPPEGEGKIVHGALTYFLGQELRRATSGTSYRDVFERAAARVTAAYPTQHPQMEGRVDRAVFGVTDLEPMRFARVVSRTDDGVTLAAGAAHGMTEGSVWAVYPQGTKQSEGATELGMVEITAVRAVQADARVVSETTPNAIVADCRAVERMHAYGALRMRVQLAAEIAAAEATGVREAKRLRETLAESRLVQVVDLTDATAAARVYLIQPRDSAAADAPVPQLGRVTEPTWVVVGTDGQLLMSPKRLAEFADIPANLDTLARARQALDLENPNPDSALRGKFELELLRRGADGKFIAAQPEAAGGLPVFEEGEDVAFEIKSRHDARTYITLVDFDALGAVSVVFPPPNATDAITPTVRFSIGTPPDRGFELTFPDGYPFLTDGTGPTEALETIKLFATTTEADFRFLEQGSVRSGEAVPPQPPPNPLQLLWESAGGAQEVRGVRPKALPVAADDWTTVVKPFVIRRKTGVKLSGSADAVTLGTTTITAPGLAATATTLGWETGRATTAGLAGDNLSAVLADEGAVVRDTIAFSGAKPTEGTRGAPQAVQLDVADPGSDFGQLLVHTDELGVVTWHFAEEAAETSRGASVPGAAGTRRYRIPTTGASAIAAEPGSRGAGGLLANAALKQFLKVVVFPLVEPALGAIAHDYADRWESKKRPYRVRTMTPDDYAAPEGAEITGDAWRRLAEGRSLLFVHGTFSRAHSAFGGLVGSSRVDLQACKLEYSIVSPK